MRPYRPLLAVAVLLWACGGDEGSAPVTPSPSAGTGGSAGGAGAVGGAGQAGSAGTSSTAGAAGAAGLAGAGAGAGGLAGTGGASGAPVAAGAGGVAGAPGGGQAGAAGLAGAGGSAAGLGGAGGGVAGAGGDAGKGGGGVGGGGGCSTDGGVCDCKSPRSPSARGVSVCAPGAAVESCDCSAAPAPPNTINVAPCEGIPGEPASFKDACANDAEFPSCRIEFSGSGSNWVPSYCATPLAGPTKVTTGDGLEHAVRCCKAVAQ